MSAMGIEGWPQIDYELILQTNPEVIITDSGEAFVEQLKGDPLLASVAAVQSGKVYHMGSAGPRSTTALSWRLNSSPRYCTRKSWQGRHNEPRRSEADRAGAAARPLPLAVIALLLVLLAASVVLATGMGAVAVPPWQTLLILLNRIPGLHFDVPGQYETIIWAVRLPRVVCALLVGFALGISGAAMQGFFRNPMASPDIVGMSAGASMGSVLAITLGWTLFSPWLLPASAFLGTLLATFVTYALATQRGRTETATLLLAGIAVSSFFSSAISLIYHFIDDGVLRQIVYWLMGNLSGKRWNTSRSCFPSSWPDPSGCGHFPRLERDAAERRRGQLLGCERRTDKALAYPLCLPRHRSGGIDLGHDRFRRPDRPPHPAAAGRTRPQVASAPERTRRRLAARPG